MKQRLGILIIIALLLGGIPAGATTQEVVPEIFVVGWDRLDSFAQASLRKLLHRVPRERYSNLREIHIDGEGFNPQALNQINCVSGTALYAICAHELGHQMDVSAPAWLRDWAKIILKEAGCEPIHYVRSTLPRCYFTDFPQEFLASMIGEYLLDSTSMWVRALDAAKQGVFQPLDQMILLTVLFYVTGDSWATVLAYDDAIPTLWTVQFWRCGGPSTISGPGFIVTISTDETCHSLMVDNREGI